MSLAPDDPRHGTANGYNNWGCRCPDCREANRLRMQVVRDRNRALPIPASVPHGLASTYENYSCRCSSCTQAKSDKGRRAWRRACRVGLEADDPRHGTPNGYNNWGCRCLACWAAASTYKRARAAKAAAS